MIKLVNLPAGKRLRDVLPQFAFVEEEVGPIGVPCPVCASCVKRFSAARKPRMALKVTPILAPTPFAVLFRLCGACAHKMRLGGESRDSVVAAVEKFIGGGEVDA